MIAMLNRLSQVAIPPLLLLAIVCGVWQAAVVHYDIKPFLLPGPGLVAEACWKNASKLFGAATYTGSAAVLGLLISLVIGTLIALVFSQSRWIRSSGYPYALFLQTVPIVAIAPLIVYWCGRGYQSVVLTSFLISLFPILANGTAGLLNVDPDLLDLFRLNNASRWQVLTRLRLPNSIPAICTGLKTSCGMAVVGAVVGEYFAGYGGDQFGLGYLILFTTDQLRMAELFAAVLASTGLSVLMFSAVSWITALILDHWYGIAAQ